MNLQGNYWTVKTEPAKKESTCNSDEEVHSVNLLDALPLQMSSSCSWRPMLEVQQMQKDLNHVVFMLESITIPGKQKTALTNKVDINEDVGVMSASTLFKVKHPDIGTERTGHCNINHKIFQFFIWSVAKNLPTQQSIDRNVQEVPRGWWG